MDQSDSYAISTGKPKVMPYVIPIHHKNTCEDTSTTGNPQYICSIGRSLLVVFPLAVRIDAEETFFASLRLFEWSRKRQVLLRVSSTSKQPCDFGVPFAGAAGFLVRNKICGICVFFCFELKSVSMISGGCFFVRLKANKCSILEGLRFIGRRQQGSQVLKSRAATCLLKHPVGWGASSIGIAGAGFQNQASLVLMITSGSYNAA